MGFLLLRPRRLIIGRVWVRGRSRWVVRRRWRQWHRRWDCGDLDRGWRYRRGRGDDGVFVRVSTCGVRDTTGRGSSHARDPGRSGGMLVGVRGAALTLVGALAGCAATPPLPTALDQQPPELVSAFFGLDDSLPSQSIAICPEAPGRDGMPVTFSRRVVGSGIQGARVNAAAFTVVTRSRQQMTPVGRPSDPASDTRFCSSEILAIRSTTLRP